jgi:hypothetical protein
MLVHSKAHDKWHYNQIFAWGDQVSYGCDGRNAWIQDTRGVQSMDAALKLDLQLLFDIHSPMKLNSLFPELAVKDVKKVGDTERVVLEGVTRNGRKMDLVFNRSNHLLERAGELGFSDYRKAGTVIRPHIISFGSGPLRLQMQFYEFVHNQPLDDSRFRKPLCPLPFEGMQLYKEHHPVELDLKQLEACVGHYQHPTRKEVVYIVSREDLHLFLQTSLSGQKIEIRPESDTNFYIQFPHLEMVFIRDKTGNITHLRIGKNPGLEAKKIK